MLTALITFSSILLKIFENVLILFAISYIYLAGNFYITKQKTLRQIISGIVIGFSAILLMVNSFELSPGLIFDSRSILFSTSALFFGPVATIVSVVIGLTYRIFIIGGVGVVPGCLTIVIPALIGVFWNKIWLVQKNNRYIEYYLFGLIVTTVTVLSFFTLPLADALETMRYIALPFLVFFPLFTFIVCVPLSSQKNQIDYYENLQRKDMLLQASIDIPGQIEIFSIDKNYNYMSFNHFHSEIMKKRFDARISIETNFLKCINSPDVYSRLKARIDTAMDGTINYGIFEIVCEPGKFYEEQLFPLKNKENEVIGVTVFTQDVTEKKRQEKLLLDISYRDFLTGFYNRRSFNDHVPELDNSKNLPISIIMADVNDLKLVNDGLGHVAGDDLLLELTKTMSLIIPSHCSFFRTGGDEFIIVLPNTTRLETKELVNSIQKELSLKSIYGLPISVAFGIGTKTDDSRIDHFFQAAENEMYASKFLEVHKRQNMLVEKIFQKFFLTHPQEELHGKRVIEIVTKIGTKLKMSDVEIHSLQNLSMFHDVGMADLEPLLTIQNSLMSEADREQIKKHVERGYHILVVSSEYSEIAIDVLSHHERFDGKGYPCGLKGEKIPYRARIFALADYFDAVVSSGNGDNALRKEKAIEDIRKNSKKRFDPQIVNVFLELVNEGII